MIYDAENTFFWNVKLSGTSGTGEVIKTGKGDAGSPLTLVVKLPGASADCTVTLETADNDKITGAKTLGTYTAEKGKTLAVKVPYGELRLPPLKMDGSRSSIGRHHFGVTCNGCRRTISRGSLLRIAIKEEV